MRPLILATLLVGLIVAPLTALAQSTPTTTVVSVVNPQGSGNTTPAGISVYGQPVAVTLAVTAGSGMAAPDGTVVAHVEGFSTCTATLGSPVGLTATGTCNLPMPLTPSVPPLRGTPYAISASYTGTATFASSISSGAGNGSLQVNKAATTTTITAHTPNPSAVNSPIAVTVLAAVTPPGVDYGNIMGVVVEDGIAFCNVNVTAGTPGSCNLIPTTPGTKTLIATNSGVGFYYEGSVSPGVSHTVTGGGATPTTTVVSVVNPQGSGNTTPTGISVYGQPVAVTLAVTAGSGMAAPDGTVVAHVEGFSTCTATLGSPVGLTATGTCNLPMPLTPSVPPLRGTPYAISASYTGTPTFASSISSGAGNGSLQVNEAATTTTITAHTPNPSAVNSPIAVTVLVAVTPPAVDYGNIMGVVVEDGSAFCNVNVTAGTPGSCNLIPTTAGTKTLIASNSGVGFYYLSSVSPGVSHTVTGGGSTPTTTVVSVVNPQGSGNTTPAGTSVYGQPVAVTLAVTAGSGMAAPDGTVVAHVEGFSTCTATLGSPVGLTATGTCNLPMPLTPSVPPLRGTPYAISASYTGTATFASSISSGAGNGSLQVNKAATTTTITAHTPNPSAVNSPIAVTVLVAVTPPGVDNDHLMGVVVEDGSVGCNVNVMAGTPGSCNLVPTTAGTKTLIATNSGFAFYDDGSVSPGVSHTVTSGGSTFTGPTVAPGVNGTVTLSGGGATCSLVSPAFVPVPPLTAPAGTAFPFGLFSFSTTGCTVGGTITVQIVYSQALPGGTQYWKFGPTPGGGANSTPHWYVMPGSTVNGTTVTFTVQDGQTGDDDLIANGTIVDQGGPAVATPIPTLDIRVLALLALMLAGLAWVALRRQS